MKKSLFAILPFLGACAGQPPTNIGIQNGQLTACPDSPNCVSSFETSEQHGIAPLEASLEQVQRVLVELDEANIVDVQENYLYMRNDFEGFELYGDIQGVQKADQKYGHDTCPLGVTPRLQRPRCKPQANRSDPRRD